MLFSFNTINNCQTLAAKATVYTRLNTMSAHSMAVMFAVFTLLTYLSTTPSANAYNIPTSIPTTSYNPTTNNTNLATPAAIPLVANAIAGAGKSIARVDFFVNGQLIGTDLSPPYSLDWQASTGAHIITAHAYDSASNVSFSSGTNITVASAPALIPTIAILSPTNATSITLPTASPITFATSITSGAALDRIVITVARTDGTSPDIDTSYIWHGTSASYHWTPLTAGTYTLTARVVDTNGNAGVSAPVTVTIIVPITETITFLHTDLMGNTIMASNAQGSKLWTELYFNFEALEFTY
jgi:Bacterial Ig domain